MGLGLREPLREGYGARDLRRDVLAGLVVGIVALPLAMALAIASGVPPQHGLYTSIVAGAVIALAGGSRVNVSGPTAAFVVLLAPISHAHGIGGLMTASLLAGIILLLFGAFRLGRLIQFVPHPVTTGFTSGIAVVIAGLQLKDFLGLQPGPLPEHFPEKMVALAGAAGSFRWQEAAIGGATLLVLVLWPRVSQRLPGPLVALAFAGVAGWILARFVPGFQVDTIVSRFEGGIPRLPPHFDWPWNFPGPDGKPLGLSLSVVRELAGPAFAIAALGAIESLLCAVVADGMTGTKHDSDVELAGQGLGNIVAPFFGGFVATGALARTATSVRAGARSPVAAVVHAAFVLVAVLALAPLMAHLPMAALAALLLIVAWNMSDLRHFVHILKVAPKSDVLVLLACFGLTVLFDMVVAVGVGVVLAALLFMQRMSSLFHAQIEEAPAQHLADPHLRGVVLYRIGGPLFFGAAEKAASALGRITGQTRAVVLQMDDVPVMDVTGLVALESAIGRLRAMKVLVILSGVQPQPLEVIGKAELGRGSDDVILSPDDASALAVLRARLGSPG
ncbi:MAG: C4-dicarboxylic acid transporter DauA [Planctomycetes bacterium]|nr:C4-dicarboxylic acid transporter DauA [Planctomycetota bacterium]